MSLWLKQCFFFFLFLFLLNLHFSLSRFCFIPIWALLDMFPVSLFFFNFLHLLTSFCLSFDRGDHFRTCPLLLWFSLVSSRLCLFVLGCWFSLLSNSPSFINLYYIARRNSYLNILRIPIKYPLFSPATLFTRKMLLCFFKSVHFQCQMLSLNLSRIICWPFRYLGVYKEKLKKFRLRIVLLCLFCIPKPWKRDTEPEAVGMV